MIENCVIKGKHILNPIIDWEDTDVWEFIHDRALAYPELYDQGFDRIGCIGCPLSGKKGMVRDFERWPKVRDNYVRAFDRMLIARQKANKPTKWKSGEEVYDWWINGGRG